MRTKFAAVAVALIALAPAAMSSTVTNPVIPPTDVGAGQVRTYKDLTYLVIGRVTVHDGGTVVIRDARLLFTSDSDGIYVEPGGTLRVERSTLAPHPQLGNGAFRVSVANATTFSFEDSGIEDALGLSSGADGAVIRGANLTRLAEPVTFIGGSANLSASDLHQMHEGVHASDADVDIHDVDFHNVVWGANYTRSSGVVSQVRMLETKGALVAQGSAVSLLGSRFDEDSEPWTIGAIAMDSSDVRIIGNTFEDWGRAIVVRDSTAVIEDNVIIDSGSDAVSASGSALAVRGNTIEHADGHAVRSTDGSMVNVSWNEISDTRESLSIMGAGPVSVVGNRIRDDRAPNVWVASIDIRGASSVAVLGNDVATRPVYPLLVANTGPARIAGNAFSAVPGVFYAPVVYIGVMPALVMEENSFTNARFYVGHAPGAQILSNVMSGAGGQATLEHSADALVHGNSWSAPTPGQGWLSVNHAPRVRIEGDRFSIAPLAITASHNATIVDATFTGENVLLQLSNDARVLGSTFTDLRCNAIEVFDSERALVANVTIVSPAQASSGCLESNGITLREGSGHVLDNVSSAGSAFGPDVRIVGAQNVLVKSATLASASNLRSEDGASVVVRGSGLTGNGPVAVLNLDAAPLDLQHNWWRDASGPQHPSNPGGAGAVVSGPALVSPWLTSPPP